MNCQEANKRKDKSLSRQADTKYIKEEIKTKNRKQKGRAERADDIEKVEKAEPQGREASPADC